MSSQPISQKQFDANCRNALKSTGPRTEEGKRRSSLNAFRHGLTGQISVLTDEERAAHDKFFNAYFEGLKPEGPIECDLAESTAEDAWRLKRARAVEDNIYALGHPDLNADSDPGPQHELATALANARTFIADPRQFQLITLYEQRLHRSMQKSLALLRQLQAERKEERRKALEEAQALAQLNYFKGQAYNPGKDFPAENGLVFSNTEINLAIERDRRLKEAEHYAYWKWTNRYPWVPAAVTLIEQ